MATATLIKTIKARVHGGVLEPLEKIELPDGQPITLTIRMPRMSIKKKQRPPVWHLGSLKGRITRSEIYGDLL